WGYVDLIVTFGCEETAKSIKVKFLVVDCPSLYQCIIGRTAIADLIAVPSTAKKLQEDVLMQHPKGTISSAKLPVPRSQKPHLSCPHRT
ncbi:hypothetical protein A2U01_0072827, partial [Trifolium medium]|nr:hypothetical protein [Trifolium medium]